MKVFRHFIGYLVDFIFPKSEGLLQIESMTASELVKNISPSTHEARNDLLVVFDYKDKTIKEIVWEIKYKGNRNIAQKCALIIYDILRAELSERALYENFVFPLLIPMPTSPKRRRDRGYNQTEIVCEEIIKLDTDNLLSYDPHLLLKSTFTESQARTHATKRERMSNLLNYMEVANIEKIKGRCIILLDDVTTSGATFDEAKRALSSAHARKVLCVALAH